jgi:hypothetical protein
VAATIQRMLQEDEAAAKGDKGASQQQRGQAESDDEACGGTQSGAFRRLYLISTCERRCPALAGWLSLLCCQLANPAVCAALIGPESSEFLHPDLAPHLRLPLQMASARSAS